MSAQIIQFPSRLSASERSRENHKEREVGLLVERLEAKEAADPEFARRLDAYFGKLVKR